MTLRLFAGLSIPDEAADRLAPMMRGVRGAAWRPRENLHVTLRFFGEIDESLARDLDHELAEIRVAPFDLTLKGAGWFGGERPHALWVGVEETESLRRLAE
ncbi:MAG: RNA 2',3'-cyclic phosphodiesterase, partial [Caulobacterales bacterium]|nr:RNA 2',3'-cyclic phosphodiesterase [Caulobacterales bacterium]